MALLQISVYVSATEVLEGVPIQEEVITIGAGSLTSNVISGPTTKNIPLRRVRFYADADCFVTWGDDPTALTNGTEGRFLGADNPEVWSVKAGQKVAVIERV